MNHTSSALGAVILLRLIAFPCLICPLWSHRDGLQGDGQFPLPFERGDGQGEVWVQDSQRGHPQNWRSFLPHPSPLPRLRGRGRTQPPLDATGRAVFQPADQLVIQRGKSDVSESQQRLARTNLLVYRGNQGAVLPVKSVRDWPKRRAEILRGMMEVMGPLPGKDKGCPLDPKIEEEVDCGDYVRRYLTYAAEPGSRVPAYLLIPKSVLYAKSKHKAPAILCLHQTHSLGQKVVVGLGNSTNDEYGVELARRGYVCLAPPYPLLANYNPDLKALGYQSGTMKAIWNNVRGLDLLESLPFVKRGRFGAIGHSLGGHNAIFTAVFDQRIKVIVSSCGFDSFPDYYGGDPEVWKPERGWCQTRYMPRLAQYAGRLNEVPFDFHELIGALAPRHVFVIAPLGDTNFKWRSVDAIASAAKRVFELYHVPQNLRVEHPDCGHSFPPAMRQVAYQLFDENLK